MSGAAAAALCPVVGGTGPGAANLSFASYLGDFLPNVTLAHDSLQRGGSVFVAFVCVVKDSHGCLCGRILLIFQVKYLGLLRLCGYLPTTGNGKA